MNDAKKRVVVLFQYGWVLTAPLGVGDAGELRKSGEPHADTKYKKNCVPERATYMLGRGQNVTAHLPSFVSLRYHDVVVLLQMGMSDLGEHENVYSVLEAGKLLTGF
ncbi:hypothetical protein QL093DRAFT_2081166 [Fusarium oxysporum]|nr:hypothetical protein QL093DRAFT_2081166 [Fusarium oxysporum]